MVLTKCALRLTLLIFLVEASTRERTEDYELSKLPSGAEEHFLTLPKQKQERMIELLESHEEEYTVTWEENKLVFQQKLKELQISDVSSGLLEESWTRIRTKFPTKEADARIEQQQSLWGNDNVMTLHQVFTPDQCATLPHQNPAQFSGRYKFTCKEKIIFVDEFQSGSDCTGEKERKLWKNERVSAVCAPDDSFVELEYKTTNNLFDDKLAGKTGIPHSSFWECDCEASDPENPTLIDCMIITVPTSDFEKAVKKRIIADGGDALCRTTKQSSTGSDRKMETHTDVDPHLKPDVDQESEEADSSRRNLGGT